eukprot:3879349-Pleurochrysis_carterae.AAC.2
MDRFAHAAYVQWGGRTWRWTQRWLAAADSMAQRLCLEAGWPQKNPPPLPLAKASPLELNGR